MADDLTSLFEPYGPHCIQSEYIQMYLMVFIKYLMHLMIFSVYMIAPC